METVFRVAIIYVFVTFFLRIIGKRELKEISAYELVMIMLIPEIASQALAHEDFSVTNALIGISTLLSLVFLNSVVGYRFKNWRRLTEGEPVVLFCRGKFIDGVLHRERVSPDEIMSEMRAAGIESFEGLKWVFLEPDGKITCIPKER